MSAGKSVTAETFIESAEGPVRGQPVFVRLSMQDDTLARSLGIGDIYLRARDGVSLSDIDALTARMRELLVREVTVYRAP